MFEIVHKQILGLGIKRLDVAAPSLAKAYRPGQFVIAMPDEYSERIPLVVMDAEPGRGIVSLVFQEDTESKKRLGALQIKERVPVILGPLGNPVDAHKWGTVVCMGYGIGIARSMPVCRLCKSAGNKMIGIFGAATKKQIILEFQMRLNCHKIIMATQDGSYENRGGLFDLLKETVDRENVRALFVLTPPDHWASILEYTRNKRIRTLLHLPPQGIDGFGRFGADWVKVDGKQRSICLDGPFFDGHDVDVAGLIGRLQRIKELMEWEPWPPQNNLLQNASKTLTRLLSDSQKNRR